MKRKFVICDCGLAEHQMILGFDSQEDEELFQTLYVEIHLRTWHNFFRRLWSAIRYAFGYHCRYGHWDELLINKEEAEKIRDFLNEFITRPSIVEKVCSA